MAGVFGRAVAQGQAMAQSLGSQQQNKYSLQLQYPPLVRSKQGVPPQIPLAPQSNPYIFQSQVGPVYNPPKVQPLGAPQLPLPTQSTAIAYTPGLPQYVHAATACSSDLHNFAARVTAYFSTINPAMSDDLAQRQGEEGLQLIENCLAERYADSRRYGGFDAAHQEVYDLITQLGRFIEWYYKNAGKRFMIITFVDGRTKSFNVETGLGIPWQGGVAWKYTVRSNGWVGKYDGGKRTYRNRRRVKKTLRKTACKRHILRPK